VYQLPLTPLLRLVEMPNRSKGVFMSEQKLTTTRTDAYQLFALDNQARRFTATTIQLYRDRRLKWTSAELSKIACIDTSSVK